MKSIATINFKGGVGKTTITWLLAVYASKYKNKKILVIDTDAQMSLTLAVQLQENGTLSKDFEEWYYRKHIDRKKTLLNALERYDYYSHKGGYFDFSIDGNFIYQITSNLYFIPSVVELYWLELEVFDREMTKEFIRALLGKIFYTKNYNFDYVFFDCPPNFTALSYSVLSCSSVILIPVNPDVFAATGVRLMIEGLCNRIQPWPNPKILVFMNKAKLYKGDLTNETRRYWIDVKHVCETKRNEGLEIYTLDSYIPERMDIKRAIPERSFPQDFKIYFDKLWDNIEKICEV